MNKEVAFMPQHGFEKYDQFFSLKVLKPAVSRSVIRSSGWNMEAMLALSFYPDLISAYQSLRYCIQINILSI